jgi:phospholipid/cholesterol/gamma-HCH transport system permease protein
MNARLPPQTPPAVLTIVDASRATLVLRGTLNIYALGVVWSPIRDAQNVWLASSPSTKKTLEVDAAQIESLDGAGIGFIIDVQEAQLQASAAFLMPNLAARYQPLFKQFEPIAKLFPAPQVVLAQSPIVAAGKAVFALWQDTVALISFAGQVMADLVWALRHPQQVRWGDFVNAAVQAGLAALPIVGLVAFLIGVILSFQSAIGMQKFGAVTFVGPLVALGVFRELGPLITAILLAGRSSAAFAAEIGTMTVNSEVDALVTGGLSPVRFLVIPRVLAGIIVAPILTLYADIVSIIASAITMTAYGVPFINFYNGTLTMVATEDILSGLLKSLLFGTVVSSVGCLRGMQTGNGAAAVGISATSAVVSSIVLIVLVDGVFAYISYRTGF